MAEEDLLFGKNRHFFGGIEPSNMKNFVATSKYDGINKIARIQISCTLPDDTVIDGQTLCSVAGVVIRKSTDGYPDDEFSGTLLKNYILDRKSAKPSRGFIFYDTDVEFGKQYYYAAFPYTLQGVYNRNASNRTSVECIKCKYYYGYDLASSISEPSTRVTYPKDVDNADYTPAAMNYTSSKFNYGSWPNTPGEGFMPKPCMLTFAGKVSEYLDPNDYTKTVDGASSNVANTSFDGNAMDEWGKIYTKRWSDSNGYHFRCSDTQLDAEYDCWCNYDINDNEIDHFYTPIFFGSSVNGKLRSISGQSNYVSNTASSEISLAKANGDDWYTEVAADRLLIQDLLVLMAKTTETQTAYGYGRCSSSNTSAIGQGTMNTKGMFWGSTDQTSGVKVFGMENWWGNLWRRTAGWINSNGTQKMKLTRGKHDGSTVEDYNLDGSGYLTISGATPAGTSGGYINACVDTKFGRVPYQASGSATTNEGDGLWFNNSQVDYAFCGGNWHNALLDGAFYVSLYNVASYTGTSIGATLSCKPKAS